MSKRIAPSIGTRRRAFFEPLENRQLLSLVVDLRLPGGGKSAVVNTVGQEINFEIWATAKGGNATGSDEALQIACGSLLSTNANGGAAQGTLAAAPIGAFAASGSFAGVSKDLDGDGDLDVGTNDNNDGSSIFAARSSGLNTSGAVSGASRSWQIGAGTFTVTSLKTGGQTNLVWRIRNAEFGGVWREDGIDAPKTVLTGTYQGGTPIVLTRDGNPPPPPPTGASVAGKAFNDADKDNVLDSGEAGINAVKLFLDTDKDGVQDAGETTATTDGSGNFKFSGLAAGSYRVREVAPSNFKVTSPSVGYFDVTLTANQALTGKNFANQSTSTATTGTISGNVFTDTNGDTSRNTGETGRASVRVYLDKDKDGVFDSTEPNKLTDASGNYSFGGIANGAYRVRIVTPSGGYRISTPSAGYFDVTVAGNTISGKNFGVTQRIKIAGRLWVDTDNDNVKDTAETVLSGWRVFIDINKDGVWQSTENSVLTDASGNYTFKQLAAGSYRVRVVQQAGYTRLAPSTGLYDVTLTAGQTSSGKNFRYKKP